LVPFHVTTTSANLEIVNLVATAELNQSIPLQRLASEVGFLYDKAVYNCAYLKDKNIRSKVAIFSSGKMICVGAKRLRDAKHDLLYTARKLAELNVIQPTEITVHVQNIVATGEIGESIDIERLSQILPNIIYEPEIFPGAIYYAKELEGTSILIFASGKVVLAGLKSNELLERGKHVLMDLMRLRDE
jgi:transcription initiation factor TFIID TATA-box-binding protein